MKFSGHYSTEKIGYKKYFSWKIPIYRVVLNKDFPLSFTDDKGITYRPDMVFSSDGGSIPYSIQFLPIPFVNLKRDVYLQSYLIHDSAYNAHGLWVLNPVANQWHFAELDRGSVDALLAQCLHTESANAAEVGMIYAGVRIGGWVPWGKKK